MGSPAVLLQELTWMVPSGTSPENHLHRGGRGGTDGDGEGRPWSGRQERQTGQRA